MREVDAPGGIAVDWDAVPVVEVLPGIERQSVDGTHQTVVRYRYAPGTVFPHHDHPEEQTTVVLSGEIAFEVAGSRRTLGPGGVAMIPGGALHGARVIGDAPVLTINVLSPRRASHPTGEGRGTR